MPSLIIKERWKNWKISPRAGSEKVSRGENYFSGILMELKKYLWESNEAERYLLLLAHNNGKYLLKLLIFSPQRRKVRAVKSLTLNQIVKKTQISVVKVDLWEMGENFANKSFRLSEEAWKKIEGSSLQPHFSPSAHDKRKKSTNFSLCGSFIIILQSDVKLSLSSVYKFQFTLVGFTGRAR